MLPIKGAEIEGVKVKIRAIKIISYVGIIDKHFQYCFKLNKNYAPNIA